MCSLGARSSDSILIWRQRYKAWYAYIGIDRHRVYLGSFASEEASTLVGYDAAARTDFGELAVLNFPASPKSQRAQTLGSNIAGEALLPVNAVADGGQTASHRTADILMLRSPSLPDSGSSRDPTL